MKKSLLRPRTPIVCAKFNVQGTCVLRKLIISDGFTLLRISIQHNTLLQVGKEKSVIEWKPVSHVLCRKLSTSCSAYHGLDLGSHQFVPVLVSRVFIRRYGDITQSRSACDRGYPRLSNLHPNEVETVLNYYLLLKKIIILKPTFSQIFKRDRDVIARAAMYLQSKRVVVVEDRTLLYGDRDTPPPPSIGKMT